jgi:hypothetical protein
VRGRTFRCWFLLGLWVGQGFGFGFGPGMCLIRESLVDVGVGQRCLGEGARGGSKADLVAFGVWGGGGPLSRQKWDQGRRGGGRRTGRRWTVRTVEEMVWEGARAQGRPGLGAGVYAGLVRFPRRGVTAGRFGRSGDLQSDVAMLPWQGLARSSRLKALPVRARLVLVSHGRLAAAVSGMVRHRPSGGGCAWPRPLCGTAEGQRRGVAGPLHVPQPGAAVRRP